MKFTMFNYIIPSMSILYLILISELFIIIIYFDMLIHSFSFKWFCFYYLFVAVRRCPEVPALKHAQSDHRNNTYTSVVTYICNIGYHFPDGLTAHAIECLYEKSWSQKLVDCVEKVKVKDWMCGIQEVGKGNCSGM